MSHLIYTSHPFCDAKICGGGGCLRWLRTPWSGCSNTTQHRCGTAMNASKSSVWMNFSKYRDNQSVIICYHSAVSASITGRRMWISSRHDETLSANSFCFCVFAWNMWIINSGLSWSFILQTINLCPGCRVVTGDGLVIVWLVVKKFCTDFDQTWCKNETWCGFQEWIQRFYLNAFLTLRDMAI